MSLNKVFANYKVYGIVIGAFIGIIVYNTIAIDFFARREEIIYTEQYVCRIFDLFYLKKNRQA